MKRVQGDGSSARELTATSDAYRGHVRVHDACPCHGHGNPGTDLGPNHDYGQSGRENFPSSRRKIVRRHSVVPPSALRDTERASSIRCATYSGFLLDTNSHRPKRSRVRVEQERRERHEEVVAVQF
jgi:hypothetical protein